MGWRDTEVKITWNYKSFLILILPSYLHGSQRSGTKMPSPQIWKKWSNVQRIGLSMKKRYMHRLYYLPWLKIYVVHKVSRKQVTQCLWSCRHFHASWIQSFYKAHQKFSFNISLSISWSSGHHSTCKEDQYGLSWPA